MDGKIEFIRFCEVVSIEDAYGADRVLVKVLPEDGSTDEKNISPYEKSFYAFPLMPKMFRVLPKKGECVLVLFTTTEANSQRYYIGPIITQDHRMYSEPYQTAERFTRGGYEDFDANPREDDTLYGVYPNETDVMVRGRKNADIQITDNDVKLRAGVKLCDETDEYNIAFNKENPSFVKLKYHNDAILDGTVKSTATIVADKINLFGNGSSEPTVTITNENNDNELIEDDKLDELMQDAHKLPYGDKLVEILKEIINVLRNHTHKYSMLPPDKTYLSKLTEQEKAYLDQEQLLSDSIRIN